MAVEPKVDHTHKAYATYVAYCRRIGVRPATIEQWDKTHKSISSTQGLAERGVCSLNRRGGV